jgi:hypothetical protein
VALHPNAGAANPWRVGACFNGEMESTRRRNRTSALLWPTGASYGINGNRRPALLARAHLLSVSGRAEAFNGRDASGGKEALTKVGTRPFWESARADLVIFGTAPALAIAQFASAPVGAGAACYGLGANARSACAFVRHRSQSLACAFACKQRPRARGAGTSALSPKR